MSLIAKAIIAIVVGIMLATLAGTIANTTTVTTPQPSTPSVTEVQPTGGSATTPTPQPAPLPPRPMPTAPTPQTKPATPVPPSTPVAPAPPPSTTAATTSSVQAVTDIVRNAVVNIICTTKTSGSFNSISASGVFIDSRGIILTNAHVGQYFLLKNYSQPDFVTCIIRTGSPASPKYTARLLYLPPAWIAANASKITSSDPTGNGEHDYALIEVTGPVSSSISMPTSFPALPISVDPPQESQQTILAAYPAGFLGGITITKDLYASSAIATVGDLFTFNANTLDLFSVGGTILSQHGSSGGAVTDLNGVLLGLIVTATDATTTATRDLRALSMPYIIGDFVTQTGGTSLDSYLSGDVNAEANAYDANTAPALIQQLEHALGGN